MTFEYMAFPMFRALHDGKYEPAVGDVVRVKTYAGAGIVAEIVADRRDGYELKYPSEDGLRVLRKNVPHWVGLAKVEKTLAGLAALRFRATGGVEAGRIDEFAVVWGEAGLQALAALAAQDPN